jgi:hypothetical protein
MFDSLVKGGTGSVLGLEFSIEIPLSMLVGGGQAMKATKSR